MIRYTRSEIQTIRKNNVKYEISEEIIQMIKNIVKEVGCPTYQKTPHFIGKKKKKSCDNLVASIPPNKKPNTTEEDVQIILNKFSEKTYEKLKAQLIEMIKDLNTTDFDKVARRIYECASNNSYNVKLYGLLYKDLIEHFPVFKQLCLDEYTLYLNNFENIRHIDSEKDYEEFCNINARNQRIKNISKFYVELSKHEIMDINHIVSLIMTLQSNLLVKGKENTPDENPCIEYTENIFILLMGCIDKLQQCDNWDKIYNNIVTIRKTDKSINRNITSKIIFKHMDILDALKSKN